MVEFTVNGEIIRTASDKSLLDFLREDLGLTSAKNGCGSGACGACTVIIDGKAAKACVRRVRGMSGRSVITAEGLTAREKNVYAYAFARTGAVQCGFCTPGMVMCAKALIDANPSPGSGEIKAALRGNLCRCTGYVKIERSILLAAEIIREKREIPKTGHTGLIGENLPRVDAEQKTLGTGLYADDLAFDGMLFGKALRTKYPRARVVRIDTSKAEAHPDCVRVVTARDVPGNIKCGHLVKDWDALIAEGGITRYIGDSLALVASVNNGSLDEILGLIEVEYERLEVLDSPERALMESAPKIHESGNLLSHITLKRGDFEEARDKAAFIAVNHYSTPFTEHAFMEPECAVALPEGEGITIYTGSQSVYDEQREISELLGIERERVRSVSMLVGGGFGGKEDMSVQHHAALLAYLCKRPVKVRFTRRESLNVHPKRHAMEIDMTTCCDENGIILGLKAEIVADTGAYASLGGPVLQRACTHAAGPYNFQTIDIDGKAVYTNNPPAGAFRGFGVTQTAFASECNLNQLAEMVGISPWEIRYRNAIRPGQVLPNGQLADASTGFVECLLAVKHICESSPYAGIGCAMKNAGLGVGVPDYGRCIVSVEGGRVHVRTSAACVGQGIATVITQMACETLGLPPSEIVVERPDTARTPNSGTTTASRQTLFTGEAVRRACLSLKERLDGGKALSELEGEEFYGEYTYVTDPIDSGKRNPVSHAAYGYAAQVVVVDGKGRLQRVVAAYDLGKTVNPAAAEGQIEGGVVMGLGYGLTEDFPVVNGIPRAEYGTLGLFRATEVPPIEVIIIEKDFEPGAAYGAKGVGELAAIPTAPACQLAYRQLDGVFRTKLPLDDTFYRRNGG